jgi:hypothetical protein
MDRVAKVALFVGVDAVLYGQMSELISSRGVDAVYLPWDDEAFELAFSTQFDVIVARYPAPGADFGRFLSAVRSQQSPSRRAGLIVIAASGTVEAASQFIGRGVNRVLSERSSHSVLLRMFKELLEVAPRVPVRTTARITADVDRGPQNAYCQTENLSATGMLLRGWAHYPVGITFDFELAVPGQGEPIRGQATVTRVTDSTREKFNGFGARFDSLHDSDQQRLEAFISEQLH